MYFVLYIRMCKDTFFPLPTFFTIFAVAKIIEEDARYIPA